MKTAQCLNGLQPSYIREILAAATSPDVISLAGGLPAESCFPMAMMAESLSGLTSKPGLFQYGSTRGYAPLLDHVESTYSLKSSDQAIVCNGSQQALDLVTRAFVDTGDGIAMEEPGYLGAIQIFSLARANMLGVCQQADGPDLQALKTLFETREVKFFYAVPDFHNPTGVSWSLQKRKLVARLCQQFGVTLIEDAPYRDIRFSGKALPMVATFCPDHAIVLRSFSKSICPGMRLGIAIADKDVISPMVKVKQAADLHTSIPMQAVLVDTLTHADFDAHITIVCNTYGERYHALCKAIEHNLGGLADFSAVEGGMFIWLKLAGNNAMELAVRAMDQKLAVVPGDVFYTDRTSSSSHLRLNFSHTPPAQFGEAVSRLKACLKG